MNRLITAEQVLARLSLPNDAGIIAAVESAIGAALPMLRAMLDTQFDAGESTDLFFINSRVYDAHNGLYTLRARNGLIKTDSVLYSTGETMLEVQSIAPTEVPLIVIADKGFIRVPDTLRQKYVKVTYEYGLAEYEDTPDWLVEGMLAYVSKVMSSTQVGEEKPVMTTLYKFLEAHGAGILNSKVRSFPGAIKALN